MVKNMNRTDIIQRLKEFPYSAEDYWVITGGAMVMYGIREQTGDIDLGCSSIMADALEKDGFLHKRSDNGNRTFRYGDDIEIFENWLKDTVTEIEGIPVISVKGLIEMKKELGREKDLKDLELIGKYISENGAII